MSGPLIYYSLLNQTQLVKWNTITSLTALATECRHNDVFQPICSSIMYMPINMFRDEQINIKTLDHYNMDLSCLRTNNLFQHFFHKLDISITYHTLFIWTKTLQLFPLNAGARRNGEVLSIYGDMHTEKPGFNLFANVWQESMRHKIPLIICCKIAND